MYSLSHADCHGVVGGFNHEFITDVLLNQNFVNTELPIILTYGALGLVVGLQIKPWIITAPSGLIVGATFGAATIPYLRAAAG